MRNRLSKIILVTAGVFFICTAFAQLPQSSIINNNLDNSSLREVYADTAMMRGRGIYSIKSYKLADTKNKTAEFEIIDGKKFRVESYTEYLPDGRKLYRKYPYEHGEREEQFFYDDNFKKLMLYTWGENKENVYYHWLFYDEADVLNEDVYYRTYNLKQFNYEGYTKYLKNEKPKQLTIQVRDYGYDSLAEPDETYIFSNGRLTKITPQYQSKEQFFKWNGDRFLADSIQHYVVEGRAVKFGYNKDGFLISEIWLDSNKRLENKTEYSYENNYRTVVRRNFHMGGTEESSRNTLRYDLNYNRVFDQTVYYDGSLGSITTWEYKYDEKGNWIERKQFHQDVTKNIAGKTELTGYDIRKILYYSPGQKPRKFILPGFPLEAANIRQAIPKISAQKQKEIDAFNKAVETGDFDEKIFKKQAALIEDFTPKFWKVRDEALGDLDGIAGDEAAVVYETPITNDFGFDHVLAIYKKVSGGWKLWHQTSSPLLGTGDGGMMGNPFVGVAIERRCIVISHFGGSRQKWNYTNRYRFQNNNWYVIGATMNFGSPCDYFIDLDYNMVTGDVVASKSTENCNGDDEVEENRWEEKFKLKRPLILMDEFSPGDNSIKLKMHKEEFFY